MPNAFIHEPWKMTDLDQQFLNLKIDYPKPKIDLMEAGKKARQKIWGHRKNDFVKKKINELLKHTLETMLLTKDDLQVLDQKFRLNLINSITGIKPANLVGSRSKHNIDNVAIFLLWCI